MKMNILVCVKQVPDTAEIKIDPVTNTLVRDGAPSIVNPFDAYAIETALRLKDTGNAETVTALSMGPTQAEAALRTCMAAGADEAWLVSDQAFAGSDTFATSYILARAIRAVEAKKGRAFDLILCGKQAIDGDTAQVGPEIAEHLDYPQITYAVTVEGSDSGLRVKRETEDGCELRETTLPAVVTVAKPSYELRFATINRLLEAQRIEIPVLTAADFDVDPECVGLSGSPTKVISTFVPIRRKNGQRIDAATGALAAEKLARTLAEDGVL